MDVVEGDVPLTALDTADVRAVELGPMGEVLLAESLLTTQVADPLTEVAPLVQLDIGDARHCSTLTGG